MCDTQPLSIIPGSSINLTATLNITQCVFDGCLPLVQVTAIDLGQTYTLSHITLTDNTNELLIDKTWDHEVAFGQDGNAAVGVFPVQQEQEALDAEYVRTSGCFENHFTSRSGDLIDSADGMFAVGNVIRYCIAAVGILSDGAYTSPQECTNVRVRFHSRVTGSVLIDSGAGVSGISVTGILLNGGEEILNSVPFSNADINVRRRREALKGSDTKVLNWRMNRTCPVQPIARDNLGRPLNIGWPATGSSRIAVVQCPAVGIQTGSTIRRRCAADGTWQQPDGACPAAGSAFSLAAVGPGQDLLAEEALEKLAYTTHDMCAWRCLHNLEACRGYLFTEETQSCVLYGATTVAAFVAAVNSTGLHLLKLSVVSETRPLSTIAPVTAGPETWCTLQAGVQAGSGSQSAPLSIPDALPEGLSHDNLLGAVFKYV